MPNRIIKESILTSPTINKLSIHTERHFYRILLVVDDYGCFEATPAVIKGKCYPLQKTTLGQIQKWQTELELKGIIKHWIHNERMYAVFVNFDKHNSKYCVDNNGKPTRHRRKTPEPSPNLLNVDNNKLKPVFASLCQSLPNPNPKPNPKPKYMSFCKFWNSLKNVPKIKIIKTSSTFKEGLQKYNSLIEEEQRTDKEIREACINLDKYLSIPMPPREWPNSPPSIPKFFRPGYILMFYDGIPQVKGWRKDISSDDIKTYGSITKAKKAKGIK